jgi:hypothetical protein
MVCLRKGFSISTKIVVAEFGLCWWIVSILITEFSSGFQYMTGRVL